MLRPAYVHLLPLRLVNLLAGSVTPRVPLEPRCPNGVYLLGVRKDFKALRNAKWGPLSVQPDPTVASKEGWLVQASKRPSLQRAIRRCQHPAMQPLAAPRAPGHTLPVALAPLLIVEERPLVLVFVRLPPEFGPEPVLVLAPAIENSHESP